MRVSIKPNDSGYAYWCHLRAHGKRVFVKLDGVPQFMCLTADDESGVVVRYLPDQYDADRQDFADEVRHGKVEIEIADQTVL